MSERELLVHRRARYVVAGDPAQASEVWLVLHGHGQLARDFIANFAHLVTDGRAVVAPEALSRYYIEPAGHQGSHADLKVGATWMTREHRVAEIADYVDYLDKLVAAVVQPGARLVALGFSQGVATLCRWVAMGAVRPERVIAWAGGWPQDLPVARAREGFPSQGVEVVLGSRDRFAAWVDAEGQAARLRAEGLPVTLTGFEGGHRLDRDTLTALANR
jgi:predicted esterase